MGQQDIRGGGRLGKVLRWVLLLALAVAPACYATRFGDLTIEGEKRLSIGFEYRIGDPDSVFETFHVEQSTMMFISGWLSREDGIYVEGQFVDLPEAESENYFSLKLREHSFRIGNCNIPKPMSPSPGTLGKGRGILYRHTGGVGVTGYILQVATAHEVEKLTGDGTVGPYKLKHGGVVPGSETVKVSGERKEPEKDYVIEYFLGLLFFSDPVPEGAEIEVSYDYSTSGEVRRVLYAGATLKRGTFDIGGEAALLYEISPVATSQPRVSLVLGQIARLDRIRIPEGVVGLSASFGESQDLQSPSSLERGTAAEISAEFKGNLVSLSFSGMVAPKGFQPIIGSLEPGMAAKANISLKAGAVSTAGNLSYTGGEKREEVDVSLSESLHVAPFELSSGQSGSFNLRNRSGDVKTTLRLEAKPILLGFSFPSSLFVEQAFSAKDGRFVETARTTGLSAGILFGKDSLNVEASHRTRPDGGKGTWSAKIRGKVYVPFWIAKPLLKATYLTSTDGKAQLNTSLLWEPKGVRVSVKGSYDIPEGVWNSSSDIYIGVGGASSGARVFVTGHGNFVRKYGLSLHGHLSTGPLTFGAYGSVTSYGGAQYVSGGLSLSAKLPEGRVSVESEISTPSAEELEAVLKFDASARVLGTRVSGSVRGTARWREGKIHFSRWSETLNFQASKGGRVNWGLVVQSSQRFSGGSLIADVGGGAFQEIHPVEYLEVKITEVLSRAIVGSQDWSIKVGFLSTFTF